MSQFLRSALGVVCPSCDGYNPPQSARCGACGASLAPAAAPAAAARPAGAPPPPTGAPAQVARLGDSVPPGMRPSAARSSDSGAMRPVGHTPPPAGRAAVPPVPPAVAPAAAGTQRFGLVVLAGKTRGSRYRLPAGGATLGGSKASILLTEDPYVSPLHATLVVREGGLFLRDEASVSGVYVSVHGQETLAPGTLFCAGARLFRYVGPLPTPSLSPGRPVPYGAPLPAGQTSYLVEEVLVGGRAGRALVTGGPPLTIGQAGCDLSFPQDESLAPRHCELSPGPSGAVLRDLSGAAGTFVRLPPGTERPLRVGDRVRVGTHVVQVEPPA